MNRNKKLKLNTITSLALEVITIISGMILPRYILKQYGSETNGLVNSITQFLSVISFLELGIGAVVQSSLYKPLTEKDNDSISKIVVSAQKFFNRLALILACYIALLILIYPVINNSNFDFWYIALLIIAIGINLLGQYYFGIVNNLVLYADQFGFIHYSIQTLSIIANTVICVILIKNNFSIQVVKFASTLIYLIRPIILKIYVDKHYNINRKIKYTKEPIKQKWNGIAQHIAAVILNQTDAIVLTIFSTLSNVSIYSVYFIVINGVKTLIMSLTNGIQAIYGEYFAKNDRKNLNSFFEISEWLIHNGTVFLYGCTGLLIVPFVEVYTNGVTDVNYIQPLFAVLITLAHACHCLRLPYNMMILAAGHYRQTQHNYIIAAILNIVISIITVNMFGLVGVAIGTLVAMLYQTIWMAYYNSNNLLERPISVFFKQLSVDIICVGFMFVVRFVFSSMFTLGNVNYFSWALLGVKTVIIVLLIMVLINCIFYKEKFEWIKGYMLNKK